MRSRGVGGKLLAVFIVLGWICGGASPGIAAETGAGKRPIRAIDRIIVSEPLPELPPANRLDIAAAPPAIGWLSTVKQTDEMQSRRSVVDGAAGPPSWNLLVWLMLTALIAAGGWYGWMQQAALAARLRSRVDATPWAATMSRQVSAAITGAGSKLRSVAQISSLARRSPAGDGQTYAADVLEARFTNVAATVARVPRSVPLREVLDDEMRRVRQRLAAVSAGSDGHGKGRVTAPAFRVMLRDLERIERIATSALRSIEGQSDTASQQLAMPVTPNEAYDVLGINGNVTDATLKKIVDALRMSWHPDLAADDSDRRAREERIKQINLASELIAAERRAAA